MALRPKCKYKICKNPRRKQRQISLHPLLFLRAQEGIIIKEKNKKSDFIKYKNFSSEDTIKKTDRQATDWQKIVTKYIPAKDLYPE